RHMEPLFPKEDKALADLAMEVYGKAAGLQNMLNPVTRREVIRLIRHINSYYSNRIEGEHTKPSDIEKAVKREYSSDEQLKRLQLLNVAHIEVQTLIDKWLKEDEKLEVCSRDFLCHIHKEFYERVPDSFLEIRHPDTNEMIWMVPGAVREREVKVGDHIPPVANSLDGFLKKFEEAYSTNRLYGHKTLLAVAASHHRLAWIHPFLDGNGRVTRLFSYAYMRKANIGSYGLWTMSRGLARRDDDYKRFLASADAHKQGNYDGRGNLSEHALTGFCKFFFDVALDQVEFMSRLLQLEKFRERIFGYADFRSKNMIEGEKPLREEARYVLAEVMIRGELPRGEVKRLIGMGERTARDLTSQMEEEELVISDSHRSPLRFHIPPKVVGYYFPALYPEGTI
ncbi:MAG: Fic family protein, partial [Balneolaceae bacterium]